MSDPGKRKARFSAVPGSRIVNPRTGQDDGKGPVENTRGKYLPVLVDPWKAAMLYHTADWYSAAVDAVAGNVAGADVFAAYQNRKDSTAKGDPEKLAAVAGFLEATPRTMETVYERLEALAIDYRTAGWMTLEVTRLDKKPVAWYHVPAATIRVLRGGKEYHQVDRAGKVVARFAPYAQGGNMAGLPELIFIRRYDPAAKYVGTPASAPLMRAIGRLGAQDSFNERTLGKGGLTPFLVMVKEVMDDDAYDRMVEFLKNLNTEDNQDQFGVLDGVGEGSRVEQLVKGAEDISFAEGEKAMRDRILGKLRVPPTKVSLPASNYATAYQEDQTFKFEVTQPILKLILKRLSVVAQELVGDAGYYYDFRQATLEDFGQLVTALVSLLQTGGVTLNQVLQRAGFPPMGPDGDIHIAFTNQGPVLVSDLVAGNMPATPGRLVDTLLQIRRAIEESQRVQGVPHADPAHED